MGSAIPIKLPENTFSHFGESVVSRRILRFLPRWIGLRKRWSLLSIVKAGKAKIPVRLINVVRASHKNEEVPPLYKPQSAQGTGKQKTALFQKWHISNFFWMGNTSLLFLFAFFGFYEIGFRKILNFFNFFLKNRYPTGFSVWGY